MGTRQQGYWYKGVTRRKHNENTGLSKWIYTKYEFIRTRCRHLYRIFDCEMFNVPRTALHRLLLICSSNLSSEYQIIRMFQNLNKVMKFWNTIILYGTENMKVAWKEKKTKKDAHPLYVTTTWGCYHWSALNQTWRADIPRGAFTPAKFEIKRVIVETWVRG